MTKPINLSLVRALAKRDNREVSFPDFMELLQQHLEEYKIGSPDGENLSDPRMVVILKDPTDDRLAILNFRGDRPSLHWLLSMAVDIVRYKE